MKRAVLIIISVLCLSTLSFAQLVFKADLEGSQVVPLVNTPASGTGWIFLYEDLGSIRFNFTFAKLQGSFTEAFFNVGKPGESGIPVQSIIVQRNTADDQWQNLPDSIIAALLAEDIYISIHSTAFPNGELRGQIKKIRGYGFPLGLSGDLTIPPVQTSAKAAGYLILNNDGSSIDYKFTVAGLSGNVTTATFNIGELGVNGPAVNSFTINDSTVSGSWTGFPDSIITHLIRNRIYLTIATTNYPDGEIRGNFFRHGELMFSIPLKGSQVIPPVNTNGSGTGWCVLSANFTKLFYNITFANLSSPVISAYFSTGNEGANGDTLLPISFSGNQASGSWDFFTDDLFNKLIKRNLYLVINTVNFPNGEIRAQLDFIRGIGFTSVLNGNGEIPANNSTAQGTAFLSLYNNDSDTDTAYYQVTISGLSSAFTEAHFHNAPYSTSGPMLQEILFTDSTVSSGWMLSNPEVLLQLIKGNIYADVHSSNYLSGEIRGQVYFSNVTSGNTVNVDEHKNNIPSGYSLDQNYPNPFNPSTIISYSIPSEQMVTIKVYNILGQESAVLVSEIVKPGSYKIKWDASSFASGVYFYRIEAGTFISIHKMILLK